MLKFPDSTLVSTKLAHCYFFGGNRALLESSSAENSWIYTQRKKLKVIYCVFVLEGLEEFNRQILWFHKEKPAWPVLN